MPDPVALVVSLLIFAVAADILIFGILAGRSYYYDQEHERQLKELERERVRADILKQLARHERSNADYWRSRRARVVDDD